MSFLPKCLPCFGTISHSSESSEEAQQPFHKFQGKKKKNLKATVSLKLSKHPRKTSLRLYLHTGGCLTLDGKDNIIRFKGPIFYQHGDQSST